MQLHGEVEEQKNRASGCSGELESGRKPGHLILRRNINVLREDLACFIPDLASCTSVEK
jgi:hypothetical protein